VERLELLDQLDELVQIVQRRGIPFPDLLAMRHDDPEGRGRLPRLRLQVPGEDVFYWSEQQMLSDLKQRGISFDALSNEAYQLTADGQRHAIPVAELHEVKELEKLFPKLEAMGLSIDDYALVQEESVTGEKLPTKYALWTTNEWSVMIAEIREVITLRGALTLAGSHIAWTAIVGAALWRVRGQRQFRWSMLVDVRLLRALAIAVTLHMLWNSPTYLLWNWIGVPQLQYAWFALLGFAAWAVVLAFVNEGLKQIRAAQDELAESSREIMRTLFTEPAKAPARRSPPPPPTPAPADDLETAPTAPTAPGEEEDDDGW